MAEHAPEESFSDRLVSLGRSQSVQTEETGARLNISIEPIDESRLERTASPGKDRIITVNTIDSQYSDGAAVPFHPSQPPEAESGRQSSRYPRPWKTVFLRAGPISGILSMVLAISSISICLGILQESDGAAVSSWSIQPSEYLAVFTAIANLAMRYACIQGVVVAWWTRALRGSTLSKLHWDWRSGKSIVKE